MGSYYLEHKEQWKVYGQTFRLRHPRARSESQKSRRAANRAYIEEVKAAPCMDCGGVFPSECMDFDHVRGDKDRDIAQMKSLSRRRVVDEIVKCDLVCANCHRTRTRQRREGKA